MIYSVHLSDIEKKYLKMKYIDGKHLFEVANELGLTHTEIIQLEKPILCRLAYAESINTNYPISVVMQMLEDYISDKERLSNENEAVCNS